MTPELWAGRVFACLPGRQFDHIDEMAVSGVVEAIIQKEREAQEKRMADLVKAADKAHPRIGRPRHCGKDGCPLCPILEMHDSSTTRLDAKDER
jgi:hypothetical protein